MDRKTLQMSEEIECDNADQPSDDRLIKFRKRDKMNLKMSYSVKMIVDPWHFGHGDAEPLLCLCCDIESPEKLISSTPVAAFKKYSDGELFQIFVDSTGIAGINIGPQARNMINSEKQKVKK